MITEPTASQSMHCAVPGPARPGSHLHRWQASGEFATRIEARHLIMLRAGMLHQPDNISAGTQVVSRVEVRGTNNSLVVRRKHAMHLLCRVPVRKDLTGAATLRESRMSVRVEAHLDRLLTVKRGEVPWAEVGGRALAPWRKELHRDFERALFGESV